MKNRFILFFALICAMQANAIQSLVVKPLSGQECISALEQVGRIAYTADSIYVYDINKYLIFGDLFVNIQHIRFSNEQPSTPTQVENTTNDNATQVLVYPNPTQDVLHVKNATADLVRLYTLNGHLVQTAAVQNGEVQLNVSTCPTGSYLLLCGNKAFQILKQ